MRTQRAFIIAIGVLFLATGGAMANPSDKYYKPAMDMPTGDVTKFPKGHVATVEHTPHLVNQQDKQGMPWFQSTLNPQNVRRENR